MLLQRVIVSGVTYGESPSCNVLSCVKAGGVLGRLVCVQEEGLYETSRHPAMRSSTVTESVLMYSMPSRPLCAVRILAIYSAQIRHSDGTSCLVRYRTVQYPLQERNFKRETKLSRPSALSDDHPFRPSPGVRSCLAL